MHNKLLIPGPTEVEDSVLDWLSRPVEAHYGDYWVSVHNETIDLLQRVFGTTGKVFMLPGSGSLAADAAVQSVFAPGQRVLLGINGHFGHRWREILEANGVVPVIVDIPPDQPLPPEAFDAALAVDPGLAGVVVVHLETSTSVLNPLQELAAVAHKHNCLIMADAVSSLGGTPLPMDEWGVDVCVSGSQKCLGGVAGLGIVAVNDRAWQAIANQPDYPRSWYLDLRRWQWYVENWGDWHPFPVTMPCSIVLALRAALQSLLAEGLDARFARYEQLAARLRGGLEDLGLRLFVPPALMAPVLTAAYCPTGVESQAIIRHLAEDHHIKITAGFGKYKPYVIRVGHMGNAIGADDIDQLLAALGAYLSVAAPRVV
jgi:alanine-glyoxylate transaminase / serine-glyoxylate transaminase / serine-pyruvate transaminase